MTREERIVDNKYRVTWKSESDAYNNSYGPIDFHHDTRDLLSAVNFAKSKKASVIQITEKEVWTYSQYLEDKKAELDALVEKLGVDKVLETLKANSIKFKVEILKETDEEVLATESFDTKSEAWSFCCRYNKDNKGVELYYYGSARTYARIA